MAESEIEQITAMAVDFRRHLHQYPESSTREFETQAYITGILDKYGISYRTYETGVIAQIGAGNKCVAIRADMDALKVQEETGLPFVSVNEGLMHACGHDMHMAMVLGAAILLKKQEEKLDRIIRIIFQPSEEKRPGGARLLLPELLKPPVPQAIFAQHISPDLPTGTIGVKSGAFFASSDNIIFSVEGKGTHAAMPHMGSDPILAVAHLVQFYQTIITKFCSPFIPAVLSVTAIHGGTANNVIPDKVEVMGTVRTHDNQLRQRIFDLIDEKSEVICELYGCSFHRDKTTIGLPVLVNNDVLVKRVIACANEIPGVVIKETEPLTLGEDFAIYLEQIPGVMWLLGVCPPEQNEMPPLHNSRMAPDERAISVGIQMMLKCVIEI